MAVEFRRSRQDDRGAVAVEFALGSVLLLVILFGVIAFGSVFSRIEVFNSAAREGARTASVGRTTTEAVNAVTAAADPYTIEGTPTVSVGGVAYSGAQKACQNRVGQAVTVSWTQSFSLNLIFLQITTPTQTFKGVFRCEA